MIAIPRLSKYGEHYNDHQREVCAELAERRALFTSPDANDLPRLLALDPTQLVSFQAPCTMVDRVREELRAFEHTLSTRRGWLR